MSKVLFYKMTYDTGFAPNPFWGYLTLATCTPNHMRANLQKGDWIVGVEAKELAKKRKAHGWKEDVDQSLVYIAKISEVMDLTSYFNDERFQEKKYQKSDDWRKRGGDNVYYKENGMWKWIRGHDHEFDTKNMPDEEVFFPIEKFDELWAKRGSKENIYGKQILQDIRGNRVFISEEFSYLGDMCIELPKELKKFLPPKQGMKYTKREEADEAVEFLESLIKKYGKGQLGNPIYCHIDKYCQEETEKSSSCGN